MEKEICTIDITSNSLRDIYTFYENHTIKRVYDSSTLQSNITEWLEPEQISHQSKDRLIKNCPEDLKETVMQILNYP